MNYILNEYVYLKKDKYTFKKQSILDNNLLVYCLVVVSGDNIHCLLHSFTIFTKNEIDKAINEYLKSKKRLINYYYKNAKPLIKLTNYKVGE